MGLIHQPLRRFAYTFESQFYCQGDVEATGWISAGKDLQIGGVIYKPLSTPTGYGTCDHNTTYGTGVIEWGAGPGGDRLSVMDYDTLGTGSEGYATFRSGTITLTLKYADPKDPSHTTDTFPLAHGGRYTARTLALIPAITDAQKCTTSGIATARITGVIGFGGYE